MCKKWLSLHKDDKKIERIIKELVSFNFFYFFLLLLLLSVCPVHGRRNKFINDKFFSY